MSEPTYPSSPDKPLIWLSEKIKTPPFSSAARIEAGTRLRQLERGDNLGRPHSRPMPPIAPHTRELRIPDEDALWRICQMIHPSGIVNLEILDQGTKQPQQTSNVCPQRQTILGGT